MPTKQCSLYCSISLGVMENYCPLNALRHWGQAKEISSLHFCEEFNKFSIK